MTKLIAVSLILAFLIAITSRAGASPEQGGFIRIFAVTIGIRTVDVGKRGPSAGDQRIAGMVLYDRNGQVIGNGTRLCTSLDRIAGDDLAMCTAIYALPRGKLVAIGTRQRRDYYVLPVVGGTRLYATVQGTLIASTISLPPRRERLLFSLQ